MDNYNDIVRRLQESSGKQLSDHPEDENLFQNAAALITDLASKKKSIDDTNPVADENLHSKHHEAKATKRLVGVFKNAIAGIEEALFKADQVKYKAAWDVQLSFIKTYAACLQDGDCSELEMSHYRNSLNELQRLIELEDFEGNKLLKFSINSISLTMS